MTKFESKSAFENVMRVRIAAYSSCPKYNLTYQFDQAEYKQQTVEDTYVTRASSEIVDVTEISDRGPVALKVKPILKKVWSVENREVNGKLGRRKVMAVESLHAAKKAETIEIRPIALTIGAEIGGVDLSQKLSQQLRDEIWAAFVKWKVVVFRNQKLDKASFVAVSKQFGPLTPGHHIHVVDKDFPEIYGVIKNRHKSRQTGQPIFEPWTGWHTDLTPAINPPTGSILWGINVPPYGGDTQWADLGAAYRALSPTMRNFVDGLRGVHTYLHYPGVKPNQDFLDRVAKNLKTSEHPIVRVHPNSGERILFVSSKFLREIVGLTPTESAALMEMLKSHAIRPEFTVRVKWEPNTVVMWDNRATAHIAPRDINESDFPRELYRTTLVGDVPVGVDGRKSVSLEGQPLLAA